MSIVAFSFFASTLRLSTSSDLAFSTSCSTVRPDLKSDVHNVKERGEERSDLPGNGTKGAPYSSAFWRSLSRYLDLRSATSSEIVRRETTHLAIAVGNTCCLARRDLVKRRILMVGERRELQRIAPRKCNGKARGIDRGLMTLLGR